MKDLIKRNISGRKIWKVNLIDAYESFIEESQFLAEEIDQELQRRKWKKQET